MQKVFEFMKDLDTFLQKENIKKESFHHILTDQNLDKNIFAARNDFSHKGNFGHGLLVAGSFGKAGACVLASKAALRSGLGLLSVHIPKTLYNILQISVPEAMVETDSNDFSLNDNIDTQKYSAIGIGCGLGTEPKTKEVLLNLLKTCKKPVLIDADGLNLLAKINNFQSLLNENIILTPHPKEFERLFGKFNSYHEKLNFMRKISMDTGATVVLKGGITAIATPKGKIFFNTIGNAGMATAGSGDVLTGIILGILTQGFSPIESTKAGVYLHALSGDLAKQQIGEISLIASDIINNLPKAILLVSNNLKL